MKKICLLLAVWISFYGNNSFAQIVTPKIDTLNNVIVSQKKTVEEIFKEVEVLKLLEIQKNQTDSFRKTGCCTSTTSQN